MLDHFDEIDLNDVDLPETIFVRDIESKVFHSIVVKSLSQVEGIFLVDEVKLFDNLLGREGIEKTKGIYVEQDSKSNSVNLKIHLNIEYGIPIPDKSDEIQDQLVREIEGITGLSVSCVHLVFKNLIEKGVALSGSKDDV